MASSFWQGTRAYAGKFWRFGRKADSSNAESWRDTLLSVTGELDHQLGGPPSDDINNRRRALYLIVSRNGDRFASDQFLRLFDFPLMRGSVAQRLTSIVPQQYLFMLNSTFMIDRAKALVARLENEASNADQLIARAYRLLYGRWPPERETKLGLEYVNSAAHGENLGLTGWQKYA